MKSIRAKPGVLKLLLLFLVLRPALWPPDGGAATALWRARSYALAKNPSSTEAEILVKIRRFFETHDAEERKELARQIVADRAYEPGKVSHWLHDAGLHGQLKPGIQTIKVALEDGEKRSVTLKAPEGYTPSRPWPLILAYHHTGGTGEEMIRMLSRRLGKAADRYVMAAPNDYLPLNVDSKRSWRPEQRLVLRELRRLVHTDSDRVYVTGFSQGCYASWSYATFYGDELAGAAPVACTFDAAPEIPGLWELLMPNVANVPVLHVWGSDDNLPVYGLDLKTVTGVAAQLNRRVVELTEKLKLNVLNHRVQGGGHAYEPPADLLAALLEKRRTQYPQRVRSRFRYLVQGRSYWLEALSWDGDQWGLGPRQLSAKPGETREQVIGRTISELVGRLDGEVRAQEIKVDYEHVGSLVVWLGENLIDWDRPIRVTANGREVFQGRVERDLYVCLAQAARTYDFDRLRWAGLLLHKDDRAKALTHEDAPSDIIYERPK